MKPTFNHVVLQYKKNEDKTTGGLYVATTQHQQNVAVVKSIGPTNAANIKEGDVVVYNKEKATTVQHDGEDYLVVVDTAILAVMNM